jgi:hypothetical protein
MTHNYFARAITLINDVANYARAARLLRQDYRHHYQLVVNARMAEAGAGVVGANAAVAESEAYQRLCSRGVGATYLQKLHYTWWETQARVPTEEHFHRKAADGR